MDRPLWPLLVWLTLVGMTVFLIVMVGGITRLTGSGLSMVDWRPILGVIPPLSEADWRQAFDAYKQYPEYRQLNPDMTLDGFRFIFFWEYLHRLLGRLAGLMFLLPLLWFQLRGYLTRPLGLLLLLLLLLGGLQGLLGWYMVQSGLQDLPTVSHYRLAAHLGLALLLLGLLVWTLLGLLDGRGRLPPPAWRPDRRISLALLGLLCLQLLFGAFTAGLHAGLGYNTFPLMNGSWAPDNLFAMQPFWLNLLENRTTIQFAHRQLGLLLLLGVFGWWLGVVLHQGWRHPSWLHWLLAFTLLQVVLGILTLLYLVPPVLASMHQALACLLLVKLVIINYLAFNPVRRGRRP